MFGMWDTDSELFVVSWGTRRVDLRVHNSRLKIHNGQVSDDNLKRCESTGNKEYLVLLDNSCPSTTLVLRTRDTHPQH